MASVDTRLIYYLLVVNFVYYFWAGLDASSKLPQQDGIYLYSEDLVQIHVFISQEFPRARSSVEEDLISSVPTQAMQTSPL
jgi:hypothetical protein